MIKSTEVCTCCVPKLSIISITISNIAFSITFNTVSIMLLAVLTENNDEYDAKFGYAG